VDLTNRSQGPSADHCAIRRRAVDFYMIGIISFVPFQKQRLSGRFATSNGRLAPGSGG